MIPLMDFPASLSVESLTARIKDLEWLEDCMLATIQTTDVYDMMNRMKELLEKKFSFDRFGILIGTMDGEYCVIHEVVTRGDLEACPRGSLMIVRQTGLEWVFNHRKYHYAPDIASKHEFIEDEELASLGIRSVVRLPLLFAGKVYGVMTMKSTQANHYVQEELNLLAKVAQYLSAGVHTSKLIQDLREQSLRDPMTGAYNRRFLNEIADADEPIERYSELTSLYFDSDVDVTLLVIDVCAFKSFNDRYGHLQGDQRLSALVRILQDIVRDSGSVVRYGGDEFVCLLPGAGKSMIDSLRMKLSDSLAKYNQDHQKHPLTISIGVEIGSWHTLWSVFEKADQRMYAVKQGDWVMQSHQQT
jgi:diguanylate cyclase (GGDEF)-like protein